MLFVSLLSIPGRIRTPGLFVLALGAFAASLPADSMLPVPLDAGPHQVGFRTLLLRDFGRGPIPAPGLATAPTDGRLVTLHVWYPAAAKGDGIPLTLRDYADRLGQNVNATPLDDARRSQARERFIASVGDLGGDRAVAEREAERLLSAGGLATRNAAPLAGKFPVVLFPEYFGPASNSMMAEYLASHGYTVVTVPMLAWRDEVWPGGTPPNFESYIGDLQFALGALVDLPFADRSRIAAMGVGISANAVAALQMRVPLIRAHVSLDGGLISPTEDATLKRTPFFDATAVRTPMLFIWSPHPSLRPELADQYKYADRLWLHLPGMTEFRYLNYGPLDVLVPGLMGASPGDVASGYTWAARYVRAFLDAHLRDNAAAREFLSAAPEANGVPAGLIQRRHDAALPAPPSLAEVRQLITERGAGAFTALYRELVAHDPEPFTMAALLELQIWAGSAGRDPDGALRKEVALVRLDAFPRSSRAHYALGMVAVTRNEPDLARTHLAETLRLLDGDPDPSLNDSFRTLIRQRAETALQNLPPP